MQSSKDIKITTYNIREHASFFFLNYLNTDWDFAEDIIININVTKNYVT